MQTIQVIFTDTPLPEQQLRYHKKYTYNIDSPVAVGDILKPTNVKSRLQVVHILPEPWSHVNTQTSELRNEKIYGADIPIKNLILPTA